MRRLFALSLVTALAATLALPAAAALPTLTSYAAYGYYNAPYSTGEDVFTSGSMSKVADNAAFASMASLGVPVAQAYVDTAGYMFTNKPNGGAKSSAAVQYDFLVFSDTVFSEVVPIVIHGRSLTNASGTGSSGGYVKVNVSGTPGGLPPGGVLGRTNYGFGCTPGADDCGKLIDFEFHLNIASFGYAAPGEIGRLSLLASAQLDTNSAYSSSASSWVDPVISIDPSYLASHPGASVTLGPLAGNSLAPPPVPEPGSLALMTLGLGAVLWRRRRAKP